jgi:2-amino-4-hydroxy-6-hydroxymethyldihydropteridine diphosphokinase
MIDCYVGMGGNQEGTLGALRHAVAHLKQEKGIKQLTLSRLYHTRPVSPIKQPFYLNAACRFQTSLSLSALWQLLQRLERAAGKTPKPKESPRLIDLDLLFYGSLISVTKELVIPHPRWHERLFVLAPLADVTHTLPVGGGISIKEIFKLFSNPHQERVTLLQETLET